MYLYPPSRTESVLTAISRSLWVHCFAVRVPHALREITGPVLGPVAQDSIGHHYQKEVKKGNPGI